MKELEDEILKFWDVLLVLQNQFHLKYKEGEPCLDRQFFVKGKRKTILQNSYQIKENDNEIHIKLCKNEVILSKNGGKSREHLPHPESCWYLNSPETSGFVLSKKEGMRLAKEMLFHKYLELYP